MYRLTLQLLRCKGKGNGKDDHYRVK